MQVDVTKYKLDVSGPTKARFGGVRSSDPDLAL